MSEVTRADLDRVHADLHDHIEKMHGELKDALEQLMADLRRQDSRLGKNEQTVAVQEAIVRRLEAQTDNQWKAIHGRRGVGDAVAGHVAEMSWKAVILLAMVLLGMVELGKIFLPELLRHL